MQALEKDRVLVLQQAVHQAFAATAHHHVWQAVEELQFAQLARVVVHLVAQALQLLRFRTTILEAMQMHLHTQFRQGLHLVEHVDDAAIVRRCGNIEAYDMQVMLRQGL
jgi:hypothetical protein